MPATLEFETSARLETNPETNLEANPEIDLGQAQNFDWSTDGIDPDRVGNDSLGLTDELLDQLFNAANASGFTQDERRPVDSIPDSSCGQCSQCNANQSGRCESEIAHDEASGELLFSEYSAGQITEQTSHQTAGQVSASQDSPAYPVIGSDPEDFEILNSEKKSDFKISKSKKIGDEKPVMTKTRGQVIEEKIRLCESQIIELNKQEYDLQEKLKTTRKWRKDSVEQLRAMEWELGALGDSADLPADLPSGNPRSSSNAPDSATGSASGNTTGLHSSASRGSSSASLAADPGKTALLTVLGATEKQIEKFQMEDIRTVCDFERALNDRSIEKVRGIQERTMDKLKDKLIEWRSQHPVPSADDCSPGGDCGSTDDCDAADDCDAERQAFAAATLVSVSVETETAEEIPAAESEPVTKLTVAHVVEVVTVPESKPIAAAATAAPAEPSPAAPAPAVPTSPAQLAVRPIATSNESPEEQRQRNLNAGYRFAMVGKSKDNNPWKADSTQFAEWNEGWDRFHAEQQANAAARDADTSGNELSASSESSDPSSSDPSPDSSPESPESSDSPTDQPARRRTTRRVIRRS